MRRGGEAESVLDWGSNVGGFMGELASMSRRRKWLWLAGCVMMACTVIAYLKREQEPSFGGKRLSEWIEAYNNRWAREEAEKAKEAIRQIGTNALPYLLARMDYEPTWNFEGRIIQKLPPALRDSRVVAKLDRMSDRAQRRAYNSLNAFMVLGPVAAPAIPELVQRINLTNSRVRKDIAGIAISSAGPAAFASLLEMISGPAHTENDALPNWVGSMGTNARPIIPVLIDRLHHTNALVATLAAETLGRAWWNPGPVVPALASVIDDRDSDIRPKAMNALAEFGPQARPALDSLRRALKDPLQYIRVAATNALERIAPEELTDAQER
jgi:hypothetical protein